MKPGADRLPAEVLVKIFSYLPCEDLVKSVQFVCTWWQQVSWEKELWKYVVYQPDDRNNSVIQILRLSPQLRSLDLRYATVDNDLIQFITDSCPNLEHLHIPSRSVYNNSHFTISRPVGQIKILSLHHTILSVDFQYLDSAFPNLESLCIASHRFNKRDLEHYLWKKQNTLHTLNISCCMADDLCVLPCLSVCTKLRNLYLHNVCDKVWSCKEVLYLPNISCLKLYHANISNVNDSSPVFCSFPNITVLVLVYVNVSENFFCIIARNCPQLQKLELFYGYVSFADEEELINDTLRAPPMEKLTHLYINGNEFLTDNGIRHILRLMPALIYLNLYNCELLTTGCLKFICGIDKLEVLKFDLSYKQPFPELKACDVKNKNLQLMFYNCRDVSYLDTVRRQHLRVCMMSYDIFNDGFCWMDVFGVKRSAWFKHCCLWCS